MRVGKKCYREPKRRSSWILSGQLRGFPTGWNGYCSVLRGVRITGEIRGVRVFWAEGTTCAWTSVKANLSEGMLKSSAWLVSRNMSGLWKGGSSSETGRWDWRSELSNQSGKGLVHSRSIKNDLQYDVYWEILPFWSPLIFWRVLSFLQAWEMSLLSKDKSSSGQEGWKSILSGKDMSPGEKGRL